MYLNIWIYYSDFEETVVLEVLFSYNGLFSTEYKKSIQNRQVTLRAFHVLTMIRLSFLFVCLEGILGSGAALILKLCSKLGYSLVLQDKFAATRVHMCWIDGVSKIYLLFAICSASVLWLLSCTCCVRTHYYHFRPRMT